MGLDLTAVRVHAGARAEAAASERRAHAFAYGNHIVLGRQAQRASRHARDRVLAHELVHVGQQAAPAAVSAAPHRPRQRAPPGVQRLPDDDTSILPAWVTETASAVVDVGAEAVETIAETGAAIVDELAPGLLPFLRDGGLTQLTELFCSGVNEFVGGIFASIGQIDFMSAIETTFTRLTLGVQGLQATLGHAASETLGTLLGPLVEALQEFGPQLVQGIQSVSDTINGAITGLWDNLAVPALNFLESVGGTIWARFTELVTWVWDLARPIRDGATTAWNWLMRQFGLAWDSSAGVRDTLARWAGEAWTGFLKMIEPIKRPLMVVGGILLLLSPLGPIVLLTQVLPPLWEKITWLWNNWNARDILVRAQTVLRDSVLPGILGAIGSVIGAFGAAAGWLADVVGSFGTAMSDVLGAFGVSRCLQAVTTYLDGIADQYRRLAAWARSGFLGLSGAIQAVLAALDAIFRPILDFLIRLAMVAINPGMLPIALAAAIWLWCPDRLKPPVIDFVYGLLIAFISGFPSLLLGLGPLGSVVKSGILGFLTQMRGSGTQEETQRRIDVSNKVASIAAGGGLEFIAGFAVGLLEGLIDGIIDPFRLIFLIGKVVVLGAMAIGRALAPLVRAVPGATPALEAVGARGPPTPAPAAAPGAATAPIAAAETELTDEQIAALLSPDVMAELAAAGELPVPDEAGLEQQARQEVQTEGATVGALAQFLGDIWDWLLTGAASLGAQIADALMGFIMLPDYELGTKLGFAAGFILLQALIIYFTAGEYAALKALKLPMEEAVILFLRFLDLGGELLAVVGRVLRPILTPLRRGLSAAGGFLRKLPVIRTLVDTIMAWAGRLTRFADDAARVESRAAGEAARAARSGERAIVGAADDVAPGAIRAVDEAAPAGRQVAESAAGRVAQRARLEVEARVYTEAAERLHVPTFAITGLLLARFKPMYPWLKAFFAEPLPVPGHSAIFYTASQPRRIDPDYAPRARLTEDDFRALLPPRRQLTPLRERGMRLMNRLPARERGLLYTRLSQMTPEARLAALDELGTVARDVRGTEGIVEGLRRRAGVPVPDPTPPVTAVLREQAPELIDEAAEGVRIQQRTTWRVSPDVIQTNRGVLKNRLQEPGWALGNSRNWEPHHVVPVELQGHWVFDRLRVSGGWDHNAALNGLALPTNLAAARRAGLPLHQFTRELIPAERFTPQLLQDLAFHPQWNARVLRDLNALERFRNDPDALRAAVTSLIRRYKRDIARSGWTVLR
jgi:hypothetical protein